MNPSSSILLTSLMQLDRASRDSFVGTKMEKLSELVNNFAIASAIAGGAANLLPGAGGIIAAIGQTGLVWGLYVQINKALGISMKEETMKFIGSAIITNLVTNAGGILVGYAMAAVLSFIPLVGQLGAAFINVALGYVVIYVSAILYFNLLTKVMKAKGTFILDESQETKDIINEVVHDADIKGMVKEGNKAFKRAKSNGEFDRAKKNPTCPNCHAAVTTEQNFCPNCGCVLK